MMNWLFLLWRLSSSCCCSVADNEVVVVIFVDFKVRFVVVVYVDVVIVGV